MPFCINTIWNLASVSITLQALNILDLKNCLVRVLARGVAMLFWKYLTGNIDPLATAADCRCLTHASK